MIQFTIQALRGIHMIVRVPVGMTKVHEVLVHPVPILGCSLATVASSLICNITDQNLLEDLF